MTSNERTPGLTETPEGLILAIRAVPRSHRSEIIGWKENELWVRLTKPPLEGEANEELIRILAKALDISKSSITLLAGEKSHHKKVKILGLTKTTLELSVIKPD